jgi:hypothetical protein
VGTIAWRIVGNRWSINGESTDQTLNRPIDMCF